MLRSVRAIDHGIEASCAVVEEILLGEGAGSPGHHVAAEHAGVSGIGFVHGHLGASGVEIDGPLATEGAMATENSRVRFEAW